MDALDRSDADQCRLAYDLEFDLAIGKDAFISTGGE